MFVKAKNGSYYPVSRIQKMWSEGQGNASIDFAEIDDLGPVQLDYDELTSLAQSRFQPFPATPGFYVLEPISEDGGGVTLLRYPVIGWLYDSERGVLSITSEGVNHGSKHSLPVLLPDGQVNIALSVMHEDIDGYLQAEFFSRGEHG